MGICLAMSLRGGGGGGGGGGERGGLGGRRRRRRIERDGIASTIKTIPNTNSLACPVVLRCYIPSSEDALETAPHHLHLHPPL
jgi:hypothetical protein